jgi:AraC-like DNA-binding protein
MRPVPLLKVGALLRDIAREEGPDAPCRIVAESADVDLVQVGRVALGALTPADALARISFALPYFCSHELLSLDVDGDRVLVRHAYGARFDSETLHLMSQYALAVLDRICAMSGALAPRLSRAELPAHPDLGVAHLERWFGVGIVAGTDTRTLTAILPKAVAERRFPRYSRDRSEELKRAGLEPLRNGGGFSDSVRTLLSAMLEDEETIPSLERVAEASGMSSRTFQRRLNEENQAFKRLLDAVRQDRARRLVADGDEPIRLVATRLGYSRPTSLNRSMMRWTGKNPTAFRNAGS